ncbi:MAG: ribosomal protein S5, small subunit ribosomal protein S5 [Candidatus Collierbacteria bacterium GW2011_GWC1_45_47]|nr:MAG: ribosomal protein S5, small subunit ribosomal protein S5 [Candidatus Collierbacteria bacterium GW2011_GWC1_45_47]
MAASRLLRKPFVSKKTQGGSQVAFSALVVTGDKKGKVGLGLAKAPNVADAIKKSIRLGNRDLVMVPIKEGTIPYETKSKFGAAEVLLRPAPKGTGIIAGSAVRAVVEAAGITDIVCKSLGSNNKTTNARATFKALKHIELLDKKYKLLKIK